MNDLLQWFNDHPTATWFIKTSLYIGIVLVAVYFSRRFISRLLNTEGKDEKKKTVFPIFRQILNALVYFFAFCIILEIFGVSTTPVWTVVSAMSVAVGFGAQQVFKDIFSGMLMLVEGQYVVGDTIEINGTTGEVESINLRTTILRDWIDGSVHIISNGEIRTVTNLSKNYMIAIVDLPIAYELELDPTIKIIKDLADKFPSNENLLEPISVLGVKEFDLRNLVVRVTVKTRSGENWGVERELRRYFKNELEKHDIYLPHVAIQMKSPAELINDSN